MRERRKGRAIPAVLVVITLLGSFVFLGQLFAQEDYDDMMMDDFDMMGGPGMAAAAGGLEWTEAPMPEELLITYDEFLAQTGHARAEIPDFFLFTEDDQPKENTEDQWMQLQRIYAAREIAVADVAVAGKPGFGLAARITREIAVKESEVSDVRYLYEKGLDNFSFRIGYPQVEHADIRPGITSVPLRVGVIMQVKSGVAQRYPTLVYRKLKKYDNYGTDREQFHIVDYEGGMWNPKKVWLYRGAASEWNGLWSQNMIQLTLYDVAGNTIISGVQPAGHDGGILAKLVHPDTLNYAPMYETIIPPQDHAFRGGNLNLDYTKGWFYSFSFNIPLATLASLDRAEAVLIGAGGVQGARSQTSAPPPTAATFDGDASRAAVTAGADRATDAARRGVGMSGYSLGPPVYTGPVGF